MQQKRIALALNIAETVVIALMLLNVYVFGYQLTLMPYWLVLPAVLFVANSWAFYHSKNVVLFFCQMVGLFLLFGGGTVYAMAVFCLIPVPFFPGFFSKKGVRRLVVVLTIMTVTLAGLSVYTALTTEEPETEVEQVCDLGNSRLELRRQNVLGENGSQILRGVYFQTQKAGITLTRLLYVCSDTREITLFWRDYSTAEINGMPRSVYFSSPISE